MYALLELKRAWYLNIYILTSLQLRMQIHMALCIYDLENKLVYEFN